MNAEQFLRWIPWHIRRRAMAKVSDSRNMRRILAGQDLKINLGCGADIQLGYKILTREGSEVLIWLLIWNGVLNIFTVDVVRFTLHMFWNIFYTRDGKC